MRIVVKLNGNIFQKRYLDDVLSEEYINYLADDEEEFFGLVYPGASMFNEAFYRSNLVPIEKKIKEQMPDVDEVVFTVDEKTAKDAVKNTCLTCFGRGVVESCHYDDCWETPCDDCQVV